MSPLTDYFWFATKMLDRVKLYFRYETKLWLRQVWANYGQLRPFVRPTEQIFHSKLIILDVNHSFQFLFVYKCGKRFFKRTKKWPYSLLRTSYPARDLGTSLTWFSNLRFKARAKFCHCPPKQFFYQIGQKETPKKYLATLRRSWSKLHLGSKLKPEQKECLKGALTGVLLYLIEVKYKALKNKSFIGIKRNNMSLSSGCDKSS